MRQDKSKAYLLIVILAVIWGSSFILIKRGLIVYSPVQVGALRIFVSFLCLLPFIINRFRSIEPSRWKFLAITGLFGNGIPSVLFPLAETRISSALAGILNSLTPVFTLIVGMIWFGMKAGPGRLWGLFLGLLGAVLLISGQPGGIRLDGPVVYALYVVLACMCYALSVNVLRNKLSTVDSLRTTGFALMFAGVPMGVILFSGDFIRRTSTHPQALYSMSCIILLGLFSTAISTVLFNRLIKMSNALAASSVTYLIPIVATLWGVLDGEIFHWYDIAGLAGIVFGVYLVNRSK
jgi:drug/metabolite transporter (DMT)-like permease